MSQDQIHQFFSLKIKKIYIPVYPLHEEYKGKKIGTKKYENSELKHFTYDAIIVSPKSIALYVCWCFWQKVEVAKPIQDLIKDQEWIEIAKSVSLFRQIKKAIGNINYLLKKPKKRSKASF